MCNTTNLWSRIFQNCSKQRPWRRHCIIRNKGRPITKQKLLVCALTKQYQWYTFMRIISLNINLKISLLRHSFVLCPHVDLHFCLGLHVNIDTNLANDCFKIWISHLANNNYTVYKQASHIALRKYHLIELHCYIALLSTTHQHLSLYTFRFSFRTEL